MRGSPALDGSSERAELLLVRGPEPYQFGFERSEPRAELLGLARRTPRPDEGHDRKNENGRQKGKRHENDEAVHNRESGQRKHHLKPDEAEPEPILIHCRPASFLVGVASLRLCVFALNSSVASAQRMRHSPRPFLAQSCRSHPTIFRAGFPQYWFEKN